MSGTAPDEFQPMAPEEFCSALNGEFKISGERRLLTKLSGLKLAPKIQYGSADGEFVRLLRAYTDMWLDTGLARDGVESPGDRSTNYQIHEIVRIYMKTHPALALRSADAGYIAVVPFRFTEPVPIDWDTAKTEIEETPYGPFPEPLEAGPGFGMDSPRFEQSISGAT
jgi:hypothetical protein